MFDAGLAEVVLIFVLGLLILGPERLPRVAAQLGRWVSRARRTATQLRYQLERELAMNDLKRQPFKPPQRKPASKEPAPSPDAQPPAARGEADDKAQRAGTGPDAGASPAESPSSTAPNDSTVPPQKPPPAA